MILVTGATGTTGSEVVKQLRALGAAVRALVRSPSRADAIRGPGVEIVAGDLGQPVTLAAAFKDVESVFLLSSPDPRQRELQSNGIQAAQSAGAGRIVKMSTLGAGSDSPVPLARWHAQTERQIEASGIPYTHLRPHFLMQNTLRFAPPIAATGVFHAPMRDGKISLVDARDVAAVAVAALTDGNHEGKSYDITGPEALSFAQIAEKLSAATGGPVEYVDVPPDEARRQMLEAGLPEWQADALIKLYGVLSNGQGEAVSPVVAAVAKKRPRSFDEFARDFAADFKRRS